MKSDSAEKRNIVERTIRHPAFAITGLIVGVIGIVLAVVLYSISQDKRELVYSVNPVKTQVVTMGKTTGLEVLHNGVNLGNTDITATQVAIWNSGDLSIKRDNILKDVVIHTEPPVRILEASILKNIKDYEITGFEIDISEVNLVNGKVPATWRILEKNDGASIQLIYLGSTDVDIYIDGFIESFGKIKQLESIEPTWWHTVIVLVISMVFGIIVACLYVWISNRIFSESSKPIRGAIILLIILLVGGAGSLFLIFRYLLLSSVSPPFGF